MAARYRINQSHAFGWIDNQGNTIIRPQYRFASQFSEGLAAVSITSNARPDTYIDEFGETAFSAAGYSYCWNFQCGRAMFSTGNASHRLYGFLDSGGAEVISPQFEQADWFYEELAAVRVNGLWGFIDLEGKSVIHPQFESVGSFSGGLAKASLGGLSGFINRSGEYVIAPQFPCAGKFSEERANVWFSAYDQPPVGLIDFNGSVVFREEYLSLMPPVEGRVVFTTASRRGGVHLSGYLDADGQIVADAIFEACLPFSEGYARVRLPEGGMHYIDRSGSIVLGPFWEADDFRYGLAEVSTKARRGYIDHAGTWVWWRKVTRY